MLTLRNTECRFFLASKECFKSEVSTFSITSFNLFTTFFDDKTVTWFFFLLTIQAIITTRHSKNISIATRQSGHLEKQMKDSVISVILFCFVCFTMCINGGKIVHLDTAIEIYICMHVCVCMLVFVCSCSCYIPKSIRLSKWGHVWEVRTCLGSEDILADHHHFKTVIKLLRLGFKVGVKVKVRRLVG